MENNLIFFTRFLVTEKGISICFNDEHSEKVESPISVTEKLNYDLFFQFYLQKKDY